MSEWDESKWKSSEYDECNGVIGAMSVKWVSELVSDTEKER